MGHRHRKDNTAKILAIGGTVAAVAGFVAGVLTAPKSGQETRKSIKSATTKSFDEAEKDIKKLHTDLNKTIRDTKNSSQKFTIKARKEFDDLAEKAKDTKEKAREALSAVREGESDDRNLKKAIEDANEAIEHLKDYIKKK